LLFPIGALKKNDFFQLKNDLSNSQLKYPIAANDYRAKRIYITLRACICKAPEYERDHSDISLGGRRVEHAATFQSFSWMRRFMPMNSITDHYKLNLFTTAPAGVLPLPPK
jgi:hypothetical protein